MPKGIGYGKKKKKEKKEDMPMKGKMPMSKREMDKQHKKMK